MLFAKSNQLRLCLVFSVDTKSWKIARVAICCSSELVPDPRKGEREGEESRALRDFRVLMSGKRDKRDTELHT